ncbi:MAG TPA: sulfite exporter TauE/SafE family protein [Vicinamibacterales bacterium]|nr:sulfite exporter TauE/SafE family protein [Vicinamibacterales bacterium]
MTGLPFHVTPLLALVMFAAGAAAGALGALLGIGGGVFLVPLLNLVLGLPIGVAAAISLATVIATSSTVTAGKAGRHLMNFRFGMVLEVATAAGSVLGGLTAQLVAQATLQKLFGLVTGAVALITLARSGRRNVIRDPGVDPGALGGSFFDEDCGEMVVYRIRRLPLALGASFVAGNVSSLLGIGGGVIKVPVLNTWCGMPLRAAAATSAFMIGVTATGGAIIYFLHGQMLPAAAAASILGVQLGSWAGVRASPSVPVRSLKLLLAGVLAVVAVSMFARGLR